MAPLRVSLPARSAAHTVRPAEHQPRPQVPLHERIAVSINGLAELYSTSGPTVRDCLKRGLPHVRAGAGSGRVLIPVESARRWLEAQAVSLASGDMPPADDDGEADDESPASDDGEEVPRADRR